METIFETSSRIDFQNRFLNRFRDRKSEFLGAQGPTGVSRALGSLFVVDRAGFEPAALRSRVSAFPHSGSKDDLPSGRSSASPNALCTRLIYRPTRPRNSRRTIKWVLSSVGFRSRNVLTVVYNLGPSLKNSYN